MEAARKPLRGSAWSQTSHSGSPPIEQGSLHVTPRSPEHQASSGSGYTFGLTCVRLMAAISTRPFGSAATLGSKALYRPVRGRAGPTVGRGTSSARAGAEPAKPAPRRVSHTG